MANFPLPSVSGMEASPKANPHPLAPTSTEVRPQLDHLDGDFGHEPDSTNVRGPERHHGMGSPAGFNQERGELMGAGFHVRQRMSGPVEEAQSLSWIGGKVLPPAVPRWEEQPDRSHLPSGETIGVAPTASSY